MDEKPFSHYSVQIATPFGDGKCDIEYALSMANTLHLLEHFGAQVDWARLPGCADLPWARNKIFGNFLRSRHTHLMMIDSDMGWDPTAVTHLLTMNREFIGAVGCKKKWPLEFALNNCDDHGRTYPITFEADTNIMDITEIGMAFVMISKDCAEKMAKAYNHLEYDTPDGTELAVFDPFIIPGTKRRLPEDFAFCHRWRRIGGKVHLYPYIKLTHSGKYTWEGALSDTFGEIKNEEKKAQ